MISSTSISWPPQGSQVPGFWHPGHFSGHPCAKTVKRMPGPSTIDSGSIPATLILAPASSVLDAVADLGPLGVVESVQPTDEVAGDAANPVEGPGILVTAALGALVVNEPGEQFRHLLLLTGQRGGIRLQHPPGGRLAHLVEMLREPRKSSSDRFGRP